MVAASAQYIPLHTRVPRPASGLRQLLLVLGLSLTLPAFAQFAPVSIQRGTPQMAGQSSQPVALDKFPGQTREVVFQSTATTLISSDGNGVSDIFIKTGDPVDPHILVSQNLSLLGNGDSTEPDATPDGLLVVFTTLATNLLVNDSNGVADIALRDLGAPGSPPERISVASDGTPADGPSSRPAISANGRVIAFVSDAGNLVPFDTNGGTDVFVRDLDAGTTTRVSVRSDGTQAANNGTGVRVDISGDGRFVVFSSIADLVPGDTNGVSDVFVRDRLFGTTTRISLNTTDGDPNGPSNNPVISADGRFVAFESAATDLVLSDGNSASDVFVRVLPGSRTELVSVNSAGAQGNGASAEPSISADGRFIAFASTATNLGESADSNGLKDVFLRDRMSGTTRSRVQGDGDSGEPSVSGDGRNFAFTTNATNLGTSDGNVTGDVWRSLGRPDVSGSITAVTPPVPRAAGRFSVSLNAAPGNGIGPQPRGALEYRVLHGGSTIARCLTRALDASGNGSCELSVDRAGTYTVELGFLGDTQFAATPRLATGSLTVGPAAPSTLSIAVQAPDPSLANRSVYVQAELRPRGGRPEGLITFTSPVGNCIAELPNSGCLLPFGAVDGPINASYSGDSTFSAAVAAPADQRIGTSIWQRLLESNQGSGRSPGGPAGLSPGALSADGRWFVFSTEQPYLVADDRDDHEDVFLLDQRLGLIRRISQAPDGSPGNSDSVQPAISGDGRWVAFTTYANNLLPGDTNDRGDVVIVDVQNDSPAELVSVNSSGGFANDTAFQPQLSHDGSLVAFHSRASDLIVGDSNSRIDVFVRDRREASTTRVSVSSGGGEGSGGVAGAVTLDLSPDGRFVLFHADYNNLVSGDNNGQTDLFRHDRYTGQTLRANIATDGTQSANSTREGSLSADGDRVVFSTRGSLVSEDSNGLDDVYLHEFSSRSTRLVSVGAYGVIGSGSGSRNPVITNQGDVYFLSDANEFGTGGLIQVIQANEAGSFLELVTRDPDGLPGNANSRSLAVARDGSWVSFATEASNLDPNAPLGGYMLAPDKGQARAVQRAPVGRQPNGPSFGATLSADGRHAVLISAGNNLGPEDKNDFEDIYWLDLDSGVIRLLSRDPQQADGANAPSFGRTGISANGERVAFTSDASNLVPGDSNAARDVFLADVAGGTLTRVSVATTGDQAQFDSELVSLSADGTKVLFLSTDDLDPPRGVPIGSPQQLYLRSVVGATTELLSVNTAGAGPINADVIAADGPDDSGCRVIYISNATNVVSGVTDGLHHLYLRNRCTNTTTVIDAVGETLGNDDVREAVLAGGGRYVAFQSDATNLVEGVTSRPQVYLRDLQNGTLRLVSLDTAGVPIGNALSSGLSIDDSGRYVAFTIASGESLERGFGSGEVLIRDNLAGETAQASETLRFSGSPALSGDGRRLAFTSNDDSLAVGDRNATDDVLIRDNPLLGAVYTVTDIGVDEGDTSVTEVNIDVTLSGGSDFPISVDVLSINGSATAPGDYQSYNAPLIFSSDGTQTITVNVVGDTVPEPDESFTIRVQTQGGSPVTLATGTVSILNDDVAPNVCTRAGAGTWVDVARWSCVPTSGVSPGAGDTAIFDSADDAATLSASVEVAALDLRDGLIDGAGALTVTSQFLWSGGTLDAPDTFIPITLPAGSTATLNGSAKTLRRRQLLNQGTLTWTAGTLTLAGANTELRNDAQFVVDVASGTLRLATDGASGQFFHHTFGSDRNVIKRGAGRYEMDDRIEFRNGNSVLVEAGTASFTGPGTSDPGPYQIDNGGILEFNLRSGQQRDIAGPVSGGGSLLKVGQGDLLLQGPYGAEGAAVSDGRLLFFQGGLVNLTHLLVTGNGTLGGPANLQAQRLNWEGGTISGAASSTLRLLGTSINASSLLGTAKCLDARRLIFAGEAAWTAGKLCLRSSAVIEVAAGGSLVANFGATEGLENNDASAVRLDVAGTLRKQGSAVLDSDVSTSVIGVLEINGGALTQRANLSGTGSAIIAAGARLQFAPTGTLNALLPLSGNGEVVTLSGTTQLQRPITGNTLNLLVQGSSTAQVEAALALRSLGVSGGVLQLFQSVSAAGASSYSGGTIQIFAGNLDLAGPTAINVASTDRLISCESGCSGGALRLRAGADVLISGTASARLTGSLPLILDDPAARLAIGTGATLELSGADQLQRGTLVVDGILSRATGTLGVGNGTALALSGNGTLRAATGITLNATIAPGNSGIGQLTLDGPTSITGGQLQMGLASAASFDRIVMAGSSTLLLNPAAELQPGGPYTPAAGDVFPLIQHANGARTGSLALIGGAPGFLLQYAATAVEYRELAGPRVCRLNVPSGLWDDPASWVCTPTDGFPGAIDTAIVDNGGSVDQNGSRTVTGLQLVNGTISSTADPLIVTGSFSWTGGRFTGTSSTSDFVRIESTATSVTLGGVQKVLTERELRLDADATWTTGLIELGTNGQLVIFPSRTLTTTPDTTPPEFVFGSGVGAAVNNQGRILKTGGGKSGIESSVVYEGAGTLEVAASSGEFFLHAPSSFIAGEMRAATGGRLVFANGDQNFTNTARLVGAGEFHFGRNTAPVQTDGAPSLHRVPATAFTLSAGAQVVIFDATLRIDPPGTVAFERLTLAHPLGALVGDTDLSVTQALTWSAGTISTSVQDVSLVVASSATATLPGNGLRNLTRTLDVAGTMVLEGGSLMLDGFNEIRIRSGALLRLSGNGTSTLSAGGGYASFPLQNDGRIERQGSGTTLMSLGLQQNGEVVIDAGATLEVGDFNTGPAARFVVNGTLRHPSLLSFGGGSVEGTGTLQASLVDNLAANFQPGGAAAGTLTVNGEYRQQSDARLSLDLLGTGCATADRLVATGPAMLAGGLTLNPAGGCTPVAPQEFLLLDATTLTGTFAAVSGVPTNYTLEYLGSSGEVRLKPNLLSSLITITTVTPQPTPVGQPYTVSVTVGPVPPGSGPIATGTVTITAAAPFANESCTLTLPATSCTMPLAALPGIRQLSASYSGDTAYLPGSTSTTHPVRATPTITALGQTPARTVVGEPFSVRARVSNPLSTLTPSGIVRVRPLPLGEPVDCTLVQTTPGEAEATCTGVISPIAAAKLIDIRYLGAEDQTFGTATTSAVQEVDPANTTLSFVSMPNPSAPGAAVQVDFTLAAALPSQSLLSAISGLLSVSDGVSSCTATLPATRCTLTLTTLGTRQLRARYQGDANFNPSAEVVREHLVVDGGAELLIRKRNLLRTLPGGSETVYVVEVENRGPLAVTALVRDPVPTGLSNFRWTCTGQGGAVCPASGNGALNENVVMPANSLARFVLSADVQRDPEVLVVQEARIDPPTGVVDPNPANNVARDIDPIGLYGDGFEENDAE